MNEWNDFEKKIIFLNTKVMNALFYPLNKNEFNRISTCETTYDIWHTLEITYEGLVELKIQKLIF